MPWLIGVDEAGYGPNLGPLVMTLTALRVSDQSSDCWHCLRQAVRRGHEKDDGRLAIADSKVLYSSGKGLSALETSVLACLSSPAPCSDEGMGPSWQLQSLLEHLCPFDWENLRDEPWFAGETKLPVEIDPPVLASHAKRWNDACEAAGIKLGLVRSQVIAAPRFNAIVARWDSKAAVLSAGLAKLIHHAVEILPEEPLCFVLDKQGGRNRYAAILQHCFPNGFVLAEDERSDSSVYRVEGMGRPVSVTIVPKADLDHFPVALASMVAKYLREVLMGEFNAFWRRHLPGLKPTAGYPEDAKRFLKDITATLDRLGIARETIWRCR